MANDLLRPLLPNKERDVVELWQKCWLIEHLQCLFCFLTFNHAGPGVNGLEAGQTFIVACAVLFHNLSMLSGPAGANPAVRQGPSSPATQSYCSLHCQILILLSCMLVHKCARLGGIFTSSFAEKARKGAVVGL